MAVIKDVAEYAGVSIGSVSRYLKNPMLLKEKTRLKIERAIGELKYAPSLSARGMKEKNKQRIAVVINDINNPFFANLAMQLQREARLRGMETILYNPSLEKKKIELELADLPNRSFNNMIFAYVNEWEPVAKYIEVNSATINSICISGNYISDKASNCVIDYKTGMNEMLDKAYELGHRKICYFGNYLSKLSENKKFASVIEIVEEMQSKDSEVELDNIDMMRVPEGVLDGKWDWERGVYATEKFLEQGFDSTLIIAKNDLVALGVVKTLHKHGVRVPEDISVVGCDNIMNAQMSVPGLSTVDVGLENLCEETISMLEEMGCYYPSKPIKKVFPTVFVDRESLGAAKIR